MKRLIIPSVVVLVVAAVTLSIGVFSGVGQSALTGDTAKECSRTAVTLSDAKVCGQAVAATKASKEIECPYSGKVLRAANGKSSCGEKAVAVHASANESGKEEACCEKHQMVFVETD